MDKRLKKEMEIIISLESIKNCVNIARGYINDEYEVNDKEELVVGLECIFEDIESIKENLYEMINDYEMKLLELNNE